MLAVRLDTVTESRLARLSRKTGRSKSYYDRQWHVLIVDYLEDEVVPLADPRSKGMALVGDKKGLWRYRVGEYSA